MTLPYKLLAVLFVLLFDFAGGVYYEHEKFAAYKNEQTGIVKAMQIEVKAIDDKNEEDANVAQQNSIQAINGINDWYIAHPVIRVRNNSPNPYALSIPVNHTASVNDTAPDGYAGPYSPRDTEAVAARLDGLQQRLIKGGVTVK